MKWKYIIGEIDLNRDLLLLLSIGTLYSLATALANTFVNVYLWKQSHNYMPIALYQISISILQAITFILVGKLAKRIDRVIILRAGVILLALFYISVLFFQTKSLFLTILIGMILGMGNGCYWLSFNLLNFEVTEPETRQFFNGFMGLLSSFSGMVGPIIAGYIISRMIDNKGYHIIFFVAMILFVCSVILSFFLSRRELDSKYNLIRIFKERQNNDNWKRITYANFFQGTRDGIFLFVISIYIYLSTGSELALGKYGLITSLVSFVTYYIVTRLIKPSFRKHAIFLGGLLLYLAVLFILFKVNFFLLLLYGITISIAYPIILVPYLSLTYDVIGKSFKAREYRVEYIVIREVYLNAGRIFSVLTFLISIQFVSPKILIPILMSIFGAGHFLVFFMIKNMKIE
jgi:YQGE family putative transporter